MGSKPSKAPVPEPTPAKEYDVLYKLAFIGDGSVGKTSLMNRIAYNERFYFDWDGIERYRVHVQPYGLGLRFEIRSIQIDGTRAKIYLWDTLRGRLDWVIQYGIGTMSPCLRGAAGVFLVYDTTRNETFTILSSCIEEVGKWVDVSGPNAVPMVLLGNKCDLREKKVVSYETAKVFADENGLTFFEVSAKDTTNTELALGTMLTQVHAHHSRRT